ncbi:MAG: UDP-N-acetylmuramoyl-L-alanyl-D-glutamate--2,6-diaminopimelate ligase [Candidatus Omnitrophica bacterium]|nr:UDP-N-acetylmuramoyl-L-alanyl-D-glutamate--2,6-diaminopimelate ligase [Candidatus Omnitrophota bacterium]
MKLRDVVANLGIDSQLGAFADIEIKGVSRDSREVSSDFIFIAVDGFRQDGRAFIDEAIRRGARAIVSKCGALPGRGNICFLNVADDRKAEAVIASNFYSHPSRKIKLTGITGTDGKTTTSYLTEAIFNKGGFKTGVIGTVEYRYGGKRMEAANTTPGAVKLQALLSSMLKAGIDYAVMEVSSHALEQARTDGLLFKSAVFTNLSPEHLDYHKTMEAYFQAKSRLFQGLGAGSRAIINKDSPYADKLLGICKADTLTYGIGPAACVRADDIALGDTGSSFIMRTSGASVKISTSLIGRHNIYNILAAACVGISEGIDLETIAEGVKQLVFVPGRLEAVDRGQDFRVFVDYAHTDQALQNVLSALRQCSRRRIITVFGCGGGRDKLKRPRMGRVAAEMSDLCFITSDNPRDEEPLDIIKDILSGISKNNFKVVADRGQAICEAVAEADTADVVLICGKGHEDYQIYGKKKIRFSDREAVEECLRHLPLKK